MNQDTVCHRRKAANIFFFPPFYPETSEIEHALSALLTAIFVQHT